MKGTFHGKSTKPGGGGRFAKMVSGLEHSGKSAESAKAIAASAGRAKYGKKKMAHFAAAGKKRAAHNTKLDFGEAGQADLGDETVDAALPPEEVAEHERSVPHPSGPDHIHQRAFGEERVQSTGALDGLIKHHVAEMQKHEGLGAQGRAMAEHHRDMIRGLRENHPLYAPKAHKGPTY